MAEATYMGSGHVHDTASVPPQTGVGPAGRYELKDCHMSPLRKTALVAGVLYLLTFVSIPTLFLYGQVRTPRYILGPGPDTAVIVGGMLEMIVGLAGIGTAVVLYPVLKRQNEGVALGFVGARTLEGAMIFAGVAMLLSVVTLRQAGVGAAGLVLSRVLVVLYDRIFLISQSFIPAVNALLLGSLLYQSRLVPRALPLLGFTGAVLLVGAFVGTMFNLWGQHSGVAALAAVPIAAWEFALGVYLVVKGFKSSPLTSRMTALEVKEPSPSPVLTGG